MPPAPPRWLTGRPRQAWSSWEVRWVTGQGADAGGSGAGLRTWWGRGLQGGRLGGGSTSVVEPVSTGTPAGGLSWVWSGFLIWGIVWVRRPPLSGGPGCAAVRWLQIREGGWGCDEGGVMVRGVGSSGTW